MASPAVAPKTKNSCSDFMAMTCLKPILTFPKGRNRLLQLKAISPHLTSPEGEGQIPLAVSLSSVISLLSVISLSSVIINRSNRPSPSGEARWGLKSIKQSNQFLPEFDLLKSLAE